MEQRSTPRIYQRLPAMARSIGAGGESFKITTTLDNLGAGGAYLRAARCIKPGTRLLIFIQLPTALTVYKAPGSLVAMTGSVLRAEPQANGQWGMAVAFKRPVLEYWTGPSLPAGPGVETTASTPSARAEGLTHFNTGAAVDVGTHLHPHEPTEKPVPSGKLVRVPSFLLYYGKFWCEVLLGRHVTTNPLGVRWRWRNWNWQRDEEQRRREAEARLRQAQKGRAGNAAAA